MISEIFNTIILKPVFNFLLLIINYIPGHNFGVAIILFTLAVSLVLWPSKKKQLHQSKLMQKLQPEVEKIKKATGSDKQKQQALLMELYKENGINPVGSLGSLIIQMPIFIAVINSVKYLTQDANSIAKYGYSFIETGHIKQLMEGSAKLNYHLFGVDLSLFGSHAGAFYWPLAVLAVLTALLQYFQIKQTLPSNGERRKLKDILKSNSQPSSEDINAGVGKSMSLMMPLLIGWICLISQGASSLYFFISALVGIIQQKFLLQQDATELASANTSNFVTNPVNSTELKSNNRASTGQSKKPGIKNKLIEKATERAQNKAYKPVEGVKVRLVSQDDSAGQMKKSTNLRGGKK